MSLRVASLNIWNRMGPWDERLNAIAAEVRKIAPDILGLQEVVIWPGIFDQGAILGEALGMKVYFGRHPEADVPMGNAIASKYPFARTQTFPLPHGGTEERRSLVFAEVQAPFGKVPVFSTHLNWKLHEGHVREEQIRFVTNTIAEIAPVSGFPPILVGDMNAEPESDEMRFLRGLTRLGGKSVYFADCFAIRGKGHGFTYARENPFAAVYREPSRRIDYIFVRGPNEEGKGEPLDCRVRFDSPVNGVFPSDHFGLFADISTE
ncbi:MAG: endonuclease/exonuclease/phosphatase family protein [Polyangiaceae bacterium]